jgi:tetratricopeptide (TPR) repeat protein
VPDLQQVLIQVDELVRKREYGQVIAAIEPLQEAWAAKPAEAPAAVPRLMFMLGSAYRGMGQPLAAVAAFSTALRMAGDRQDWSLHSMVAGASCEIYVEVGLLPTALQLAKGALALLGAGHLAAARTHGQRPRAENPILVLNLASYMAMAGQLDEARKTLALAREIFEARCDYRTLGQVFDASARLARLEGDIGRVRRCVGTAISTKMIAGDFPAIDQSISMLDVGEASREKEVP